MLLEGSQLNFSDTKKIIKWKHVSIRSTQPIQSKYYNSLNFKIIWTRCVKLQLVPAEKLHWFSKFDIWSFLTIWFLIDSLWWSLHIGKLKQIKFVSPETEIETDMNNMAQYLMSISQLNFFDHKKKCQLSQIEIKTLNRYVQFSPEYSIFGQICFSCDWTDFAKLTKWPVKPVPFYSDASNAFASMYFERKSKGVLS